MDDVEMFSVQNTSIEPTLHQHFSTSKGRPEDWDRDECYYLLESVELNGENNTYRVTRPLITPNESDYLILKGKKPF